MAKDLAHTAVQGKGLFSAAEYVLRTSKQFCPLSLLWAPAVTQIGKT